MGVWAAGGAARARDPHGQGGQGRSILMKCLMKHHETEPATSALLSSVLPIAAVHNFHLCQSMQFPTSSRMSSQLALSRRKLASYLTALNYSAAGLRAVRPSIYSSRADSACAASVLSKAASPPPPNSQEGDRTQNTPALSGAAQRVPQEGGR